MQKRVLVLGIVILGFGLAAMNAQASGRHPPGSASAEISPTAAPRLVTMAVDVSKRTYLEDVPARLVALQAETKSMVPADFRFEHVMLMMKNSPEREQASTDYAESMSDPRSPNHGKALTSAQIGAMFGPNPADVIAVRDWLVSEGLEVTSIDPDNASLSFSGNAREVGKAFGVQFYFLQEIDGSKQPVAASRISVPAAIAPVVRGIVSLYGIHPPGLMRDARPDSF
jgi:subtilase family serine protease